MNPVVSNLRVDGNNTYFTLSGVPVSVANAIRRTIISEIPTVVFRTTPHDRDRSDIKINTTRMNNELIKQRLSCIPIHIDDPEFPLDDYIVEISRQNKSDTIEFITTEDFRVKNVNTGKYLDKVDQDKIFPPDKLSNSQSYIDFVRLRPQISNDIPGEELTMTCKFDIGIAKEDGTFNVASTCAYAATPDPVAGRKALDNKLKEMKASDTSKDDMETYVNNWPTLNAKRYVVPNSFDFKIETVGVFSNETLIAKSCIEVIKKVEKFKEATQVDTDVVTLSDDEQTIPNCFTIALKNEDYTLGNLLQYVLYNRYYDTGNKKNKNAELTYCGFQKPHPHVTTSYIRLGFKEKVENAHVIEMLVTTCSFITKVFEDIRTHFVKDL